MRPTCGSRLGRGAELEVTEPDEVTPSGRPAREACSYVTGAGVCFSVTSPCWSCCLVTGDEGGERSKIVPV